MGKASRRRTASSGHVREKRTRDLTAGPAPFVARPFEGLTGETDWVAMREVVPAAAATVTFVAGVVAAGVTGGRAGLERHHDLTVSASQA